MATCGSVWSCPVCNAKIMARRALEIGAAVERWIEEQGRVAFMTFTVRHRRTDTLEDVWRAVSKAWNRVTSGRPWARDKEAHGVEGWVRVVEVTHGANGWHVHLHVLVLVPGSASRASVRKLQRSMFERWRAGAVAAGMAAPLLRGQDVQIVDATRGEDVLAGYLTKASLQTTRIGLEMTSTQSKTARTSLSTRSIWEVLTGATDGLADEVALWHAWEKWSKGKKQMTWSKGLRDRLGIGQEASDEDVAAEELGSSADTLAIIEPDGWQQLTRRRLLGECLESVENGGAEGLGLWLQQNEISHQLVKVEAVK